MYTKIVYFIALISLLAGCSGINMLSSGPDRSDLYRDHFYAKIGQIKEQYRRGQKVEALDALKGMKEDGLLTSEKALRRNLMGVILFSQNNYEQAIFNFDLALTTSQEDVALTAQINLNLASSYYKLGFFEKSFNAIIATKHERLTSREIKKYFLLKFNLSKYLGREEVEFDALVGYLADKKRLHELRNDPYCDYLITVFFKFSNEKKASILESYEDRNLLAISYLGFLHAEKVYYSGQKDDASDVLSWVEERSKSYPGILELIQNFNFRASNNLKMNSKAIGIVLPLSGKKRKFGERALLGADSKLQQLKDRGINFKVLVKDSAGSGAAGAFRVKELIEKHNVAAIIGGLFSGEASKEYLEAKRHGVLFISLSQIYLPKREKDHLLIEIPGSIESQVNRLFSKEMLDKFGKRVAIIYPKSERGEAYVDEFWRKTVQSEVDVVDVVSYDKNTTDYRESVKGLLNLRFRRERQEELELLTEVASLEKHTSARRIQTLTPQIDFDWIFIPAFPKEALQLLPSFTYYDAFKLNFIGGPSWRSHALSRESYKLGNLFFVGDDVQIKVREFSSAFYRRYKRRPKLIEMRSFDAFALLSNLLAKSNFKTRDEFDISIRKESELNGITGKWNLSDGLWIKDMVSFVLKRGKIKDLFATDGIKK